MTIERTETAARSAAWSTVREVVLLVARVWLGVVMLVHAKLEYDFAGGFAKLGEMFGQAGVPLPVISGPANFLLELIGGVAVIIGLAVRPIGVLMFLNMMGAWAFVHTSGLMAMDRNGPEFVLTLGMLSLVFAALGSGRFGLDHLIAARRGRRGALD